MLCLTNEYGVSFHTINHFLGPRLACKGFSVSRLASTRPGGIRPASKDKFHVFQNRYKQCDSSFLA
jgi:hypothetical protein